MADVISLLPASWLPALTYAVVALISLFALHGFVSAAVAVAKLLLGTPSPTDSAQKTRAFAVVAKLEPVALNMRRVNDALLIVKHELELAAQRRALEAQQQALAEQEGVIKLQSQVIRDSLRPPAMPALSDDDADTNRATPYAKRKP